jgi:hypothetical protein
MKPLLAFCFLSLVSPLALLAQSAAWVPVQGLGPGERIEINLFTRRGSLHGTVERVTDDTLVVRHKRGVATFNRADVRRVRIDSGRKSKFGQILATSVLAGIALNTSTPKWNRGADVAFAAGTGFLLGWGLDGMINDYRRKTIFEGQPPSRK